MRLQRVTGYSFVAHSLLLLVVLSQQTTVLSLSFPHSGCDPLRPSLELLLQLHLVAAAVCGEGWRGTKVKSMESKMCEKSDTHVNHQ